MMTLPDFRYKQCLFYFSSKQSKITFRASNLVIKDDKENTKLQHSCHKSFVLFIIGNVTLSNVLMIQAKKHGFPIILLSYNLRVDGYINNRAEGNFLLRKKQYSLAEKELMIAKKLVRQKVDNQIALIHGLRYRSKEDNETIAEMRSICLDHAEDYQELMGLEGIASKLFFSCYFHLLDWKARLPRTKYDIANLLLDIGYTYLFNFVEAMLGCYGFDIYCGVYHKFFYQRKSLVCDIIEPFRCIIDERLRKAHNLKQIDPNDFLLIKGQYTMPFKNQKRYTSLFMQDILDRKEEIFLYVQSYYRWLIKGKEDEDFPVFCIYTKLK